MRGRALVAQGIEHRFPKPSVGGSIPSGGTSFPIPAFTPHASFSLRMRSRTQTVSPGATAPDFLRPHTRRRHAYSCTRISTSLSKP